MKIYRIASVIPISDDLLRLFIENLQPWSYENAAAAGKVESLLTADQEVIKFYNLHHKVYLKLSGKQFNFTPEEKRILWETASDIEVSKNLDKKQLDEIKRIGIKLGYYVPSAGGDYNLIYRGRKYKGVS